MWALVSDINLAAQFSNELVRAEWASDDRGVRAMFHGRNQHPAIGEWTIPCFVDICDEPRAFGWRTSDADSPGARWRSISNPARVFPDTADVFLDSRRDGAERERGAI